MSRYVDVDELIARLKEYNPQTSKVKVAQIVAGNMPTISIVRCQDCKHYDNEDYGEPTRYCTWHESVVNADDYCSYGERKESE